MTPIDKASRRLFNACVSILDRTAKKMDPWFPGGMDYVKINVLLFCLVFPAVLLASMIANILMFLWL